MSTPAGMRCVTIPLETSDRVLIYRIPPLKAPSDSSVGMKAAFLLRDRGTGLRPAPSGSLISTKNSSL